MGSLSIWHWLIVLAIVVLVFGTGKLKNMGKDLGGAIKGFKEGMKEGDEDRRSSQAGCFRSRCQEHGDDRRCRRQGQGKDRGLIGIGLRQALASSAACA